MLKEVAFKCKEDFAKDGYMFWLWKR